MKTIVFILGLIVSGQLFCADKRSSDSQKSTYIPMGADDIDENLARLRDDQQSINGAQARTDFIRLCEAAVKVFKGNERVHEIEALIKFEKSQQTNN